MTRAYNLTFNNPYNRNIASKIISLEKVKNNTGQPELIRNNIPQSVKQLSGGAVRISTRGKSQLNRMLKRGRGMMMEAGNATSAPSLASRVEEMDMVQPMRRPGEFIKPVKDLKYNIRPYETNASNSPYYNQLELNRANAMTTGRKMPMTDKVNRSKAKVVSVKKVGGFVPVVMPARKVGGKRVAGIGEYKGGMLPQGELELEGGFSFSGIGKAIASAAKKIPSLIKKGAPKLAKSAFKFMKGPEGQKVIGNVLSEVGTQAVKKIFEAPPALQDENVLGSGIKVDINRDDIKDEKMRNAFDKLVVNGELRKDRLPLIRRIMKKSGMGTTKKEMTGGFIPIILGIIGAIAATASATHGIVSAENERAKADKVNQLRASQEFANKIANRYKKRQKEKGIEVGDDDPVIKKLQNKYDDLDIEAKKLGGSAGDMSDIIDKMVDALMKGAELKGSGKSTAKKGLEPKKEPVKIPLKKGGAKPKKAGFLGNIINSVASVAKNVAMKNKKGGAQCGGATKPKRQMSDKMKKRAELVKKIMKERGVKLAEASKIIKNEKLM